MNESFTSNTDKKDPSTIEKKVGNIQMVEEYNKSLILSTIRERAPISRADLVRVLRMSPTTATNLTKKLIDEGYVIEIGTGKSTGGRRPILLDINKSTMFIIVLEVGWGSLHGALSTLDGKILNKRVTTFSSKEIEPIVEAIISMIKYLLSAATNGKVIGVSVVITGVVKKESGLVRSSSYLGWKDIYLGERLSKDLNLPVVVTERVNAIALGEKMFGAALELNDFVYISFGPGIGCGLFLDGRPYYGPQGNAGELGHMSIDRLGRKCICGSRGCLENYTSSDAIISNVKERLSSKDIIDIPMENLTIKNIGEACAKGNEVCLSVLRDAAYWMGYAIGKVISLLNCEALILGGEIPNIYPEVFNWVLEAIEEYSPWYALEGVSFLRSQLGEDAALIGAASVMIKDIFEIKGPTNLY